MRGHARACARVPTNGCYIRYLMIIYTHKQFDGTVEPLLRKFAAPDVTAGRREDIFEGLRDVWRAAERCLLSAVGVRPLLPPFACVRASARPCLRA